MGVWTVLYEVIGCQFEIRENGLLEPEKGKSLLMNKIIKLHIGFV